MENNYKSLLIDKDVYAKIGLKIDFEGYDYICIPMEENNIQNSKLYKFKLKGNKESTVISFKEFIEERKLKCDSDKWLYISKDINSVYTIKEKNNIPCCFINMHYNDVVDIEFDHEINSLEEESSLEKIEKILVKKKQKVIKMPNTIQKEQSFYRIG